MYAVCMTEDYEAAKAAMEQAGAEYPLLKASESLREILTLSGHTAPAAVTIQSGALVIPGKTSSQATYVERPGEVVFDEPNYV